MSRTAPIALGIALAPLLAGGALLAGAGMSDAAPAPPPAPPVVFEGHGFGHGVGMSQYGARGRALAGWDHPRILAHYYPGTVPGTAPPRTIRVLLAASTPAVTVSARRAWRVVGRTARGGRRIALRKDAVHTVQLIRGGVVVRRDGRRIAAFRGTVRFETTARRGVLSWGARRPDEDRRYRGALRVGPAVDGGLRVANIVDVEDYLRGVVPREMPAGWGDDAPAALRAQAVAARSYALATLRRGEDFEVYDDTRSQVYGGVAAEDARTTRAVTVTRGDVLTYDGAIATTYFHSTSGGRTENVEWAWPGAQPVPYLVSVADPFDDISPLHDWTMRFGAARLGRLLGVGGPVTGIEILQTGVTPRVLRARITTAAGASVEMSGADMRARLGLHDTWFTVRFA